MMFKERHPLCLDEDNEIVLEGGLSSTHTKAFTINIKKCLGSKCLSDSEINYQIDGLIVNVLAIQDHVDFQKYHTKPIMKIV